MKKILCVGSVTADVMLCTVDALPPPGTLMPVKYTSVQIGGCAANAAMDLRRLGCPVQLSCKVGEDIFGDYVCAQIAAAGMDERGIARDRRTATTVSTVLINGDGERSFLYMPGSAAQFTAEDIPDALVEAADIIFVGGALLTPAFDGLPCAGFLRRCREAGKITVMDTAWDYEQRWAEKIAAAWPYLDWFLPSYEEAARLSGEEDPEQIARHFMERGVQNVIVKLGARGAYVREKSGEDYRMPAYPGIQPVDTTGAGDAFCAGFLAGIAQGWTARQSVRLANAVGAHCITRVGASEGIPDIREVLKFMAEREEQVNEG